MVNIVRNWFTSYPKIDNPSCCRRNANYAFSYFESVVSRRQSSRSHGELNVNGHAF
jgi:hypothetical protein